MSTMERNKGSLVPFTLTVEYVKKFLQSCGVEYDPSQTYKDQYDDYLYEDDTIVKIEDTYYEIQWEVERETDCYGFADVKKNDDGSIDFHTYHYNGGGHWTELVEEAL